MGEFFKPWRRKIGVMTLLMALVFMAGWVRSLVYNDDIRVFVGKQTVHELHSSPNGLAWMWTWDGDIGSKQPGVICNRLLLKPHFWVLSERGEGGRSVSLDSAPALVDKKEGAATDYNYEKSFPNARWTWNRDGIRFGIETIDAQKYRAVVLTVPYWSITIPMTLLSLWLLLSKPRKSNQSKINGPISAGGE